MKWLKRKWLYYRTYRLITTTFNFLEDEMPYFEHLYTSREIEKEGKRNIKILWRLKRMVSGVGTCNNAIRGYINIIRNRDNIVMRRVK